MERSTRANNFCINIYYSRLQCQATAKEEADGFGMCFQNVKIGKQETIEWEKTRGISHDVFIHKIIIYESKESRTWETSVRHFDHNHIIACWRSSNSSSSSRSISISCSNEHAKAAPPNKTKTKKQAERRLARINILLLSSEFMRNFRMKSVFSELKRVLNQSAIMFSLCLNNFVTFFVSPTAKCIRLEVEKYNRFEITYISIFRLNEKWVWKCE